MKLRISKKLLRHPLTQSLLAAIMAFYIRLVMWTARMERHVDPAAEEYVCGKKQAIFAFWHGRLFLCSAFKPPRRAMHVLISNHRDGVLISKVIAHFSIRTVEGSSNRRSLSSLRELLRIIKNGDNITITPDGPRGPFQEAAPGVVYLAKTTALPMIPVAWSAASCRRLGSWDKFMLPYPFSRVAQVIGAPVFLDKEAEEETSRRRMTEALNAATARADELTGIPLC